MKKFIVLLFGLCVLVFVWFVWSEVYSTEAQKIDEVKFDISQGDTVEQMAEKLENENIIRNAWLFKRYLIWKKWDYSIHYGNFELASPITLARVAEVMARPGYNETQITVIPGWNLRQVAEYLVKEGWARDTNDVLELSNYPSKYWHIGFSNELEARPDKASLEGYLAPNTYRVYKNAGLQDILAKLIIARNDELNRFYPEPFQKSGMTAHQILTLASIIEKEVNTPDDMAMVADIFLRRLEENWALQSCATVNYITGKNDPGVSASDKKIDSPYNTYKYPGLPPGPICNPGLDAIKAVLEPKKNDFNYFMTGDDGVMRYAGTLEGHNLNVTKYLK